MAHIMVVDDEQDILELTQFAFEARGHTVQTAPSGEEALEHLGGTLPQFLVVDYKLKQMTGLDFLKAVRENNPNIPAIMITGLTHESETLEQACRTLGQCTFFHKPLQMEQVLNAVEEKLDER